MTHSKADLSPERAFLVGAEACESLKTGKPKFSEFKPDELEQTARMLRLFAKIAAEGRHDVGIATMGLRLLMLGGKDLT